MTHELGLCVQFASYATEHPYVDSTLYETQPQTCKISSPNYVIKTVNHPGLAQRAQYVLYTRVVAFTFNFYKTRPQQERQSSLGGVVAGTV